MNYFSRPSHPTESRSGGARCVHDGPDALLQQPRREVLIRRREASASRLGPAQIHLLVPGSNVLFRRLPLAASSMGCCGVVEAVLSE
jgi:hypothetical protein